MTARCSTRCFCRTWRRPIVWRIGSPATPATPRTSCRMLRCAPFAASGVLARTIVRNTAYSWLMKNRPKAVVFTDDLSAAEQQQLEHEGPQGTRIETPEEIALFKADAENV